MGLSTGGDCGLPLRHRLLITGEGEYRGGEGMAAEKKRKRQKKCV